MQGKEWERAVRRHLIPQLPGQWRAWTWVMYMEPMDWFTKAVIVSIVHLHIKVTASVQLLAAPRDWWVANLSIHLGGYGRRWPIPSTTVDAERILDDLAPLIRAEAVPFFEENATLDGYLAYLNGRVSDLAEHLGDGGWQDTGVDEELTYLHLLRGDMVAAEQAASWAERAGLNNGRALALDRSERVRRTFAAAVEDRSRGLVILQENAARMRAKLKLPPA